VSLRVAARLVGLRAGTFAELADLREGEAAMQRAALSYFGRAFHSAFPWCDSGAVRRGESARSAPRINVDGRPVTRSEAALLAPPQRCGMRKPVPSPRNADPEVERYLAANPVPLFRR